MKQAEVEVKVTRRANVTTQVDRLKGFRLKCSELRPSAFNLHPYPSSLSPLTSNFSPPTSAFSLNSWVVLVLPTAWPITHGYAIGPKALYA